MCYNINYAQPDNNQVWVAEWFSDRFTTVKEFQIISKLIISFTELE